MKPNAERKIVHPTFLSKGQNERQISSLQDYLLYESSPSWPIGNDADWLPVVTLNIQAE